VSSNSDSDSPLGEVVFINPGYSSRTTALELNSGLGSSSVAMNGSVLRESIVRNVNIVRELLVLDHGAEVALMDNELLSLIK